MADADKALEDAHAHLLTNKSFQFELPDGKMPEIQPEIPDPDKGLSFLDWLVQMLQLLGPLFRVLLIGAAIVLVAYVVYSLVMAARNNSDFWRKSVRTGSPEDDLARMDIRPDQAFAKDLLSEADRLAAEGRYGEAVRLILHSSIRDMQDRIRQRIGVSLTAREVGGMGKLPDPSREALRRIIALAEVSVFGEMPVDEAGYQDARRDYTLFALKETAA